MTKRKTTTATAPPDWYLDLWPTLHAVLGPNVETILRTILAAETEVSAWLSSRGRRPAEPLRPADLRDAVREVGSALSAPRFSTVLTLLWREKVNPEIRLGGSGEVFVASERPLSERPPKRVRVVRPSSRKKEKAGVAPLDRPPTGPPPPDPFGDVVAALSGKLSDVPLTIPATIRALAWDGAASVKAWKAFEASRKVGPAPAPKAHSAEAIAERDARDQRRAEDEAFRKERARELGRAEAAGLPVLRRKPGRPKKSGH